ncbi:MAG: lipid-A-disaccharide synthase [Flavobacteriales bacterium]|nr:lipid-A-disaccharide synthase [Flavobacteriales bacterium]
MHYYIISGELSGDLYGSKLMCSLKKKDINARFTCWGGEYMKAAGGNMVRNLDDLSFIGFLEVLKNGCSILKNYLFAKKNIKNERPDAVILIDYPGFNLQIAKYAKKINIPVFWFIAPQVWAWKKNRIKKMQKYIDKLFVALPFELEYFSKHNIETYYFGHPLLDVKLHCNEPIEMLGKPIISLMPGSRKQEVKRILPVMLQVVKHFLAYRFVVICANSINRSFYEDIANGFNVELKFDKHILSLSEAVLVASGTATLELTILNLPQVVCYKLHPVSYLLARFFANIKYISLVNILANKMVVSELIQNNFNAKNLIKELNLILSRKRKNEISSEYDTIVKQLGEPGCFDKISKEIYLGLI